MRRYYKRLLFLVGGLALLLVVAALLYMLGMSYLEGKPRGFWEALEWSAETLSTTGYGADTAWHSPLMVLFVVVLQFIGVFLVFLVLPLYLFPWLEERFETRLPKEVPNVKDHVIIFHHGPPVVTLLEELKQEGIAAVIVEEEEAHARRLIERGHRVVFGSLDEGVLKASQIEKARALIVNSTDERNAAIILAARQVGFSGEILALVENPLHRQPIMLAGATAAYTPRHILGAALAARASRRVSPTVAGIQHLGHKLQVTEARVTRNSVLMGKTLAEAGLGQHMGVTVIGQWVGGKLMANPSPEMRLQPGGILILVGSAESIQRFLDVCAGTMKLRRHGPFLVAGHGEVGQKVIELLKDAGEETRVIDSRPGNGVDLVGNVLDPLILQAADVNNVQAAILALDADTTTLFTTVILKDLAPDLPVIARVNLSENVERIYGAGADFALSISQVSGQILAWRMLGKEAIDVDPQLRVMQVSARGLEGHHLDHMEIRKKTGCSIVAVERGEELLVELGPHFQFEPTDSIFICGSNEATEKYLQEFPQQ